MPYICLTRSDVEDGTVQVLDLVPNTSLRNASIDPAGQTRYVNRVDTSTVTIATAVVYGATIGKDATGLAAYVADTCLLGGALLSTVQVASAVEDIVGLMDAGLAITTATVNTSVQSGTYSGSALGGTFDCTAMGTLTVENLLKVLSGAHYKIDKGTTLTTAALQGGFYHESKELNISTAIDTVRKSYSGDEFNISLAEGHMYQLAQSIRMFSSSIQVPNKNGTISGSPSKTEGETSTGYPARQLASMKNLNSLTAAASRVVVVYADDGSVLV